MSYLSDDAIASSATMQHRVAQAAAEQGLDDTLDPATERPYDPDRWATTYRRTWAGAPGWSEAWEYALASHPPETEPDYDPGADGAVITDGMILSQVQGMLEP